MPDIIPDKKTWEDSAEGKASCLLDLCRVVYRVSKATDADHLVDGVNRMVFLAADWLELDHAKFDKQYGATDYITDLFDWFCVDDVVGTEELINAWRYVFSCFQKFHREPYKEDLAEFLGDQRYNALDALLNKADMDERKKEAESR